MSVLTPRINNLESERNVIINGNFDFWQRGSTFSVTSGGGQNYTADRWYLERSSHNWDIDRDTDVPSLEESGFLSKYSLKVTQQLTAAIGPTAYCFVGHRIEGYDTRELLGKQLTLSFWVKSSKAGLYSLLLSDYTSSLSTTRHDKLLSYTINSTDTWEKKTITFNADAVLGSQRDRNLDNETGFQIAFVIMSGSNFENATGRDWTAITDNPYKFHVTGSEQFDTVGDTFKISQVMLHVGESSGNFQRCGKNIAEELNMCRRYYIGLGSTATEFVTTGVWVSGTYTYAHTIQPVTTMRDTPSINWPSIVSYGVGGSSINAGISLGSVVFSGNHINFYVSTTTNRSVDQRLSIIYAANGYSLDAEL